MLFGFILTANGCQSAWELENTPQDFDYTEADGEVNLTLANGEGVRMQFGENSVKVYDAYRHKSAVYEIVVFICAYGEENGSEVHRKKKELAGELKLHNLLYTVGYERGRTKDADVEYTADSRWYVNLASIALG